MERNEQLKAEILDTAHQWQRLMDLGWVTVNHTFVNGFKDDEPDVCADTEAYWEYRQARMRWYLASISRLTKEELDATVAHEYGHLLVAPIERHVKSGYDEQCEFAVESIARALISVRNSGILGTRGQQ